MKEYLDFYLHNMVAPDHLPSGINKGLIEVFDFCNWKMKYKRMNKSFACCVHESSWNRVPLRQFQVSHEEI